MSHSPAPSRVSTPSSHGSALDRFFRISERGSTVGREVRGGLVTFFTMAYIIVLNPLILGGPKALDSAGQSITGGPVADLPQVAAVTALVAGVMSILMGMVANFPLAIATGLGLNALIATAVISDMTWADAMGLVVIEGLIILVLVLTGFRKAVLHAVPSQLKVAISVGIGLFIALIGLVDAGVVRSTGLAAPPIGLGIGNQLQGWPVVVFAVGLVLMVVLYALRVHGAILVSIVVTTLVAMVVEAVFDIGPTFTDAGVNPVGWNLNVPVWPDTLVDLPDLSLLGNFSLLGSFEHAGAVTALLFVFTLLMADFFDTMGTMTAIGAEAGLNDDEDIPPHSQKILVVDSLAAVAGGAASSSSNTAYIESASGVGEGARTGLASVVTGLMFLAAMFVAPLVTVVPNEAAVPALLLVGFLMMQQVKEIDWDDLEIAFPAFLTIALMPFAYSITVGIGAGFCAYVLLKVVRGRAGQVHPLMWLVSVLFVAYFAIHPLTLLLS